MQTGRLFQLQHFALRLCASLLLGVGIAFATPVFASTTSSSPIMQRTWGVEDTVWSTAHDATNGQYTFTGSIGYTITVYGNSSLYSVYRDFQIFDTSYIGLTNVVTSGTYTFYVTLEDADDPRQYALYGVSGDQTTIATSSYSGCGTVPLSGYFSSDDFSVNNYYSVALNATGLSYVSTTGKTQFCIRDATKDVPNISPPGPGAQSYVRFDGYTATHPPILTIEKEPLPFTVSQGGTGATSFTLNGVLLGNGTNPIQATAAGSAYQILRVPAGGGAPSFGALDLSQSAAVTGALSITNGGTGTSTASGARITLGAAKSGANSDITSLSGLTTALSFGQGGTGATTAFATGSIMFVGDGMFKQNNANFFWDDANGRLGLGTSSPTTRLEVNGTAAISHFKGLGSAPAIATGACAGIGGSVSLTGTDAAGTITLNTGTAAPGSATCFTVTFASAYASVPYITFSPTNDTAAGLFSGKQVYASSTASTFTFTVGSLGLSNSTSYKWNYHVIE